MAVAQLEPSLDASFPTQPDGRLVAVDPHAHPLRHPLPFMAERRTDRALCRTVAALAQRRVLRVEGVERVHPRCDPFILALNHNQRLEAVLIPTLLIFARGGKLIHFLADWNFLMVPLVGTLFRRSGAVIVGGKSARPRLLNLLKPWLVPRGSPLRRARRRLEQGRSIGVFPEGTVNRDPQRLLPGHRGAATLALTTGVPLLPAGIRFPRHNADRPIGEWEPMELRIGELLPPPSLPSSGRFSQAAVEELHQRLMESIAALCGKRASPPRSLT